MVFCFVLGARGCAGWDTRPVRLSIEVGRFFVDGWKWEVVIVGRVVEVEGSD